MVASAQHPLYYDGFGIAVLHLETYTNGMQHGMKINDKSVFNRQKNRIDFTVYQISANVLYDVQDPRICGINICRGLLTWCLGVFTYSEGELVYKFA